MKLELKHLAGYLPYKLNIQYVSAYNDSLKIRELEITSVNYSLLKQDKPILRPLSDLTKEIDVNSEKFVPIKELKKLGSIAKKIDYYYYSQINKMLEWHFDIHGLIESGLAIDINTLNK